MTESNLNICLALLYSYKRLELNTTTTAILEKGVEMDRVNENS